MDYEFDYQNSNMEQPQQDAVQPDATAPVQPEEPQVATKKKRRVPLAVKVTALGLCCALVGGLGGSALMAAIMHHGDNASQNVPAMSEVTDNNSTPLTVGSANKTKQLTPSEVYENNVASVVGVNTTKNSVNVFGQVTSSAASGSGFVLTEDGYIVTNCHVISGGSDIQVSMYDGSTYSATVVGQDETNDVALLKIDATGLQPVSIGDSDSLQVGEMVFAIGNPLGELTYTQTIGYVSALDRTINTDGNPISMLQTDAAINPGNSGGPLLDSYGNVIGITTAKYASDEIEGLGFAIPINDAMKIVYDLQQYGYVKGRAGLGITVKTLDQTAATAYNLPMGLLVNSVNDGSCSEKAGMQQGDIITAINDEAVLSYADLVEKLNGLSAGDKITLTVYRNGKYQDLKITLDEKQPVSETEQTETTQSSESEQAQGNSGTTDSVGGIFPWSFFGY